jgi:hypothetical protein
MRVDIGRYTYSSKAAAAKACQQLVNGARSEHTADQEFAK